MAGCRSVRPGLLLSSITETRYCIAGSSPVGVPVPAPCRGLHPCYEHHCPDPTPRVSCCSTCFLDREDQVGHAVALDAGRRVAEQDVLGGEPAEERPVALTHHDRYEVDGHLV